MRFQAAAVFTGRLPPSLFLSLLLVGGSVFSAVSQEAPTQTYICECPDGSFSFESDMPCELLGMEELCPGQCPKAQEGGNVNVVFDQPQDCQKCRKFKAEKLGPCHEVLFTLFNRGVVNVTSCPSANTLSFIMTGADLSPFTSAERSFFTKTANNVRNNAPGNNANTPGTLDRLVILASEALAAWPMTEFPINHYYPSAPSPTWFVQDYLLAEEECPDDRTAHPTSSTDRPTVRPTVSSAPTSSLRPTIPTEAQNDLITCIAVIDENNGFTPDDLWAQLRTLYPDRPFCLLQPNQPGDSPDESQLPRPAAFVSDGSAIYSTVNRDNGDDSLASDWYNICNMQEQRDLGLTRVALFTDDSGSMTTSTVNASRALFDERLEDNGFEIVSGVNNKDEDWISPCMTTTLEELPAPTPREPTATAWPTGSRFPTSSLRPSIPFDEQNELITCIAVIDESDSVTLSYLTTAWNNLRNLFPFRPFCLLQPNQPGNVPTAAMLPRPTAFSSDGSTIFAPVARTDRGDPTLSSDWYEICNLQEQRDLGLTRVALFVDTSGSMTSATVQPSLDLFDQRLADNGFEIVSGDYNSNEDWIDPCYTTRVEVLPTPTVSPTARPTRSLAPSGSHGPTISIIEQNELITCIAVIDESNGNSPDALWANLRAQYPDRPFCLLQPNQPGDSPVESQLPRPAAFTSDGSAIYSTVNRDQGVPELASDWYDICNMQEQRDLGLTRVALFVDTSGSMTAATVDASKDLFDERLEDNGFVIVSGTYNNQEDWVTPCLTTRTIP